MTLELTMEEARQVDWALAHRQDRLSEMVQQSVPELAMVYRDELEACNSVIHKLAPMFANAERQGRREATYPERSCSQEDLLWD